MNNDREQYHSKAVFIVGPSSTGKTTLCRALTQDLTHSLKGVEVVHIEEVARKVMKETGFTRADVEKLEVQKAIMMAQLDTERSANTRPSKAKDKIIIGDRSAIDSVVYAGLLGPVDSREAKRNALIELTEFKRGLDYYRSENVVFVLLRPVQDWLVDDGIRSMDDPLACFLEFKKVLELVGIRYYEMGEELRDLKERVASVKEKIRRISGVGARQRRARDCVIS